MQGTARNHDFQTIGGPDVAFREMSSAALLLDDRGRILLANDQACALLSCDDIGGKSLPDLLAISGVAGSIVLPENPTPTSALLRLSDGRTIKAVGKRISTGGTVVTFDDVSGFARDAELARRDPLTALANRNALSEELAGLLRRGEELALFALDLDRFKPVNDALGHAIGDALLRKVAMRLQSAAGADAIVARVGGDEFTIVKMGLDDHGARALAERIVDLIGRAFVLEGHQINIGASVGVAMAPSNATEAGALARCADLALYKVKAASRSGYHFFEADLDARMQQRRALEIDLRRALAFKELDLVYQPVVRLESGEVIGFEALLRWNRPGSGTVSPADFIPIAEEAGLMVPIGEWVLRTACREAVSWAKPVSIAVNISPVQFRSRTLVETVTSALAHSGLDPARLELEITESALIEDTETVVQMLTALRSLGVRVAMDDFGTGYSSLSYLQKFPFDKIKIDQSFIREMIGDAQSTAIVRAVAALGTSLGVRTTAEGVETREQLDAIRAEGCSEVQGYLTGRPLSSTAAAELLTKEGTNNE